MGGCDNARHCHEVPTTQYIYNKCLNLRVFVNDFEAMKAYPKKKRTHIAERALRTCTNMKVCDTFNFRYIAQLYVAIIQKNVTYYIKIIKETHSVQILMK